MPAQIPRPLHWAALIGLLLAFVFLIAKCVGSPQQSTQEGSADETLLTVFELVPSGGDSGRARAEVRPTETGLAITLKVEDLPQAPAGSYYELWLVGKDDTPGTPNRVSAGTFRAGSSETLSMRSAADLEHYPRMEVTLEPDNGNPAREGVKKLASPK